MMASQRGKASAARNAPFGTDIQPKRNMKIVGGKQIEIAVDSPPTSASTLRSLPPLQQGPNGTPPMEVQPPYQEYHNNNIKLEYPEKQTAPADKSNSHIHGTGGRHHSLPAIHAILPPIPSPNSLSPSRDSWNKSRSPSPTLVNQPEVSLTDQLRELFVEYDPFRFQDMYKDLAEYDRKLSGFVSQPQVNMIAMKHQLPIPTNMLRLLFSNFCKEDNVDMVNYEKLIQYLARAQLGTAEAETLLQESVNRFVNAPDNPPADELDLDDQIAKYETTSKDSHHRRQQKQQRRAAEQRATPRDMRQIQSEKTSRQTGGHHDQMQSLGSENEPQIIAKRPQRVFSDREDAKLLMLLEQQYIQGNQDPTDLQAMKKDFMERDTRSNGTLTKEKIQEVCFKHRIPLQGSLMEKLMQRCDTGENQHSWVAFLEFLGRVKPLATQAATLNTDVARPSTWPKQGGDGGQKMITKSGSPSVPQEPAPPPWETRKPLGRLGIKSPTTVEREITLYDSPSPPPLDSGPPSAHIRVDHGNSEQAELAVMAQENRQKRQQAMAAKIPVKVKEDQPWFARFKHLAKGLYNLDSTNTGYLSREETVGLVNNYNLIYRLELQQSQIDRCVASCSYAKGQVSIEHLLEALRLCVQ
ncbi:uncharacterized protein C1orf87-like isoform X2 [Asterias amurensis]|uniref:uncharacterized protein C1orf87-like isoform X2 n=1 Tax=Asterias amurensis TaxID=7602 RepID=UPI003AB84DD6